MPAPCFFWLIHKLIEKSKVIIFADNVLLFSNKTEAEVDEFVEHGTNCYISCCAIIVSSRIVDDVEPDF